jgi:DNA invertase Pin-like site-specific DNA recombinase
MIKQLREADVVVVTTYDRLSGFLQDLLNIGEAIRAKGVGFRTMAEDSTTNAGRLVFASIAQFERERISEQTKEGLCLSTSEGGLAASPPALSPEHRAEAVRMHDRKRRRSLASSVFTARIVSPASRFFPTSMKSFDHL